MKIVALDGHTLNPGDNSWSEVEALGDLVVYPRTPIEEIIPRSVAADIIVTNKAPLTRETIESLPNLKFITVTATGYNIVDVESSARRQIPVSNVPIYGTSTVAQHVFATLLSFIHRPFLHDEAIRDGQWQERGDFSFSLTGLTELAEKTMGIVGFGRIGQNVARIANAFGMNVVAYNPSPRDLPNYQPFRFVSLEKVFRESDVISLHCPQTTQNEGFVNRKLLDLARDNLILVNSARGGLINDRDLAEALNNNQIAGACLDVFSSEPVDKNNPLTRAKNVLMTPHNAWATIEARQRLMRETARNIRAFMDGAPINVVNQ